jgi:hypothetical protein
MSSSASAIGGGIPARSSSLVSGVTGDTTAAFVTQETALVRSIDLRGGAAGDGEAWAVFLFGSACFLAAAGYLVVWLRGRVRRMMIPARVTSQPTMSAVNPEPLDP